MRRKWVLLTIMGACLGCGRTESTAPVADPMPTGFAVPDTPAPTAGGPLGVGSDRPQLMGDGWLNGDAPSDSDLEGKVLLVDVWAHW